MPVPPSVSKTEPTRRATLAASVKAHWPEYLIEAAGLGFFMVSACSFGVLLEHPESAVRQSIDNPLVRRALMGLAMGMTAIAIIYSPWGKRSGAHINPSVTLTFFSLGRIERWDALLYTLAQFLGAAAGVTLAAFVLGMMLSVPQVHYVVTAPGSRGVVIAFVAEVVISFVLMVAVLAIANTKRLNRYTGLFAGALVALYITVEAPFSGMSMNPARTFGSAVIADDWRAVWIYFAAPVLGMLSAAGAYRITRGTQRVFCAKLHHENNQRCIFRCNYGQLSA